MYLNSLLASRICHDLISPLGAIGNGVELLAMSGVAAGPELSLITESVANANARIRFFRVAFGPASPGQTIGRAEIVDILPTMTRSGRQTLSWQAADTEFDRRETKLAFLCIGCLEAAMPWGGKITVTRRDRTCRLSPSTTWATPRRWWWCSS
jgi:histidine phosphotransferase ChpT